VGSNKDHELKLVGYADADYGSNFIDRISTTGYVFIFNLYGDYDLEYTTGRGRCGYSVAPKKARENIFGGARVV
jgi:hypothetical protein